MNKPIHSNDDFRIEISGWGLDNNFFAERTELLWTADGEKHVQLHHALPEGAMVFIRLLAPEPSSGSVPVAYRVQSVVSMDCNGRCRMKLEQLRPRVKWVKGVKGVKESPAWKNASKGLEDSQKVCDVQPFESQLLHEEILQ